MVEKKVFIVFNKKEMERLFLTLTYKIETTILENVKEHLDIDLSVQEFFESIKEDTNLKRLIQEMIKTSMFQHDYNNILKQVMFNQEELFVENN